MRRRHKKKILTLFLGIAFIIGGYLLFNYAGAYLYNYDYANVTNPFNNPFRTADLMTYASYGLMAIGGYLAVTSLIKLIK